MMEGLKQNAIWKNNGFSATVRRGNSETFYKKSFYHSLYKEIECFLVNPFVYAFLSYKRFLFISSEI